MEIVMIMRISAKTAKLVQTYGHRYGHRQKSPNTAAGMLGAAHNYLSFSILFLVVPVFQQADNHIVHLAHGIISGEVLAESVSNLVMMADFRLAFPHNRIDSILRQFTIQTEPFHSLSL